MFCIFLSSNLWHHLPTLCSSVYSTEWIHKSHKKKTSISPTYHINSEPLTIIAQHSFLPLMRRNTGCSFLMFKHTTFSLWTLLKKFTIERPPFHHKLFPSTQSLPLWHKTCLLCFPSSPHFFPPTAAPVTSFAVKFLQSTHEKSCFLFNSVHWASFS